MWSMSSEDGELVVRTRMVFGLFSGSEAMLRRRLIDEVIGLQKIIGTSDCNNVNAVDS
jgi:hypothetical protein